MPKKEEEKALTEAEMLLPALEPESGIEEPENALPRLTLAELPPKLQSACEVAGWTSLTPVQSLALPYLLAGRDIMVQSRTGSGKTGCYLLPMLESIDPKLAQPQALVLAPTRELASQVDREAKVLFAQSGIKSCAVYGGVGYKHQLQALRDGVQVIIGTPGRVMDLLARFSLDFKHLRVLVFDEADRMLSIGFYPDIKEIARYVPEKRQTMLFSATYPPHVLQLAREFMHDPEMLSLSHKQVHVPDVEHLYCQVNRMDKDRALVRLLETENPSSAVIFCNTKADVHYVSEVLKGFGYRADEISADLPQKKREAVLAKVRSGEIQYLVATDVAGRGIDIPDLSHVFMYDPPQDRESYIHRAGRTGRAGAAGTVITLVDMMQKMDMQRLARFYKINLNEMKLPTDEEVAKIACERLDAILEGRLRALTGLEQVRINRYLPLAREILTLFGEVEEEDEKQKPLSIMAMLLDDTHRLTRNETRFPKVALPPSRKDGKPAGNRRRPRSGKRPPKPKTE